MHISYQYSSTGWFATVKCFLFICIPLCDPLAMSGLSSLWVLYPVNPDPRRGAHLLVIWIDGAPRAMAVELEFGEKIAHNTWCWNPMKMLYLWLLFCIRRWYPTLHHFVTEMCTHVHISVTKWCIVRYDTDALWDLCNRSITVSTFNDEAAMHVSYKYNSTGWFGLW